jgi:structural maintenance of chromosome 3 (chondroitin sulfate proteoglycan 6)
MLWTCDSLVISYEAKKKDEDKKRSELVDTETRLNELFAKQARAGQYRTKKERDAALKLQISDSDKELKKERKLLEESKNKVISVISTSYYSFEFTDLCCVSMMM